MDERLYRGVPDWNTEYLLAQIEFWQDSPDRHLPDPEIMMGDTKVRLNREAPDVAQFCSHIDRLLDAGIPEETILLSIRCMQIRNPENLTLKGVLSKLEERNPSESIYDMDKLTGHIRTLVKEQENAKANPSTELQHKARLLFVEATKPMRYQAPQLSQPIKARFANAALTGLGFIHGQDRESLLGFNPDHYECEW